MLLSKQIVLKKYSQLTMSICVNEVTKNVLMKNKISITLTFDYSTV